VEILNKFNLAPPPSSPSKGGINKVFPPQEGDLRGRKVLLESRQGISPSGGDYGGGTFCFGRAFWVSPSGGGGNIA